MKSRVWKTLRIVLVVLVVLIIAAAIIIPRLIDPNRYKGLIASKVEKATGGKVSVGRISWGISHAIWVEVDGFSIDGATAFPGDLELSRISAEISILPLLAKKVVVEELLLKSPVVKVRLATGGMKGKRGGNLPSGEAPAPSAVRDNASSGIGESPADSSLPVKILIQKLAVQGGRITVEDSLTLPGKKMVRVFRDVEMEATNVSSSREVGLKLALRDEAKPGLGSLEVKGTFSGLTEALTLENPRLKLKVNLSSLDLDTIKAYLRDSPLLQRAAGSVSLEVNYEGDFGRTHKTHGLIDLTRLRYTDSSLWEKPLPGVETTINYQVTLAPDRLTVEQMSARLGKLTLRAHALVDGWRTKPVIRNAVLSADLPLAELIPLVPWGRLGKEAGVIRSVLEGGGTVTVEKVSLPEIIPARLSAAPKALWPEIDALIRVSGVSVRPSADLPKIEDITGTFQLEKGVAKIEGLTGRVGSTSLPKISGEITDFLGKPKVLAHLHGQLELGELTEAKSVKHLLMERGLESLSGTAGIDLTVRFDQAKPEQWEAAGSFALGGIRVVTHPAGMLLDDLRGRVGIRRKNTMEVTVQDLSARLNRAPIRVQGKLSGVDSPRLVVDAKVRTERLDLADLAALVPGLEDLKLGGTLDMNVNVHFPYADPMKTRLEGEVNTTGVSMRLPTQGITLKEGDAELDLLGNAVKIKRMTLRANGQQLAATGRMEDPLRPHIQLNVRSPELNVDRLLPPARGEKRTSSPPRKGERGTKGGVSQTELSPLARKLTARFQVEAEKGQYRGERFRDLKLRARYKDGVLKVDEFDLGLGGGRIQTSGSADLRNPKRVGFSVVPGITTVRLESIETLLGMDKLPVQGPLTMAGHLTGKTGSTKDLLSSLRGNLEWEVGQGRLTNLGPGGNVLVKILSYKTVEKILMGRVTESLSNKGMPFDSIKAMVSLGGGDLTVDKFHLQSDVLNMDARGTVDLVRQRLNVEVDMEALGTVDKVLDALSVLGKTARRQAKISLKLRGSLADPKIGVSSIETLPKAPREGAGATERETDALELLDKGLEILLGK